VIEIPNDDKGRVVGYPTITPEERDSRGKGIDLPRETVAALVPPKSKEPGVEVECVPSDRELVVRFRGNIVCVLKWLPALQRFLIKRCQELLPNNTRSATWLQYQGTLHQAWQVAGELGVTVEEFQTSFVEMPPEIPWTGRDCPEHRTDCAITYAGNPTPTTKPDLACRTCGARFKLGEDDKIILLNGPSSGGEGSPADFGGQRPAPQPTPQPSFERDLVRYQGMGRAKLEKLQEHGITSWQGLLKAGPEFLAAIPGFSPRTAEFLLEIAKEKAL